MKNADADRKKTKKCRQDESCLHDDRMNNAYVYFWTIWRKAQASWSGHDVPFIPQRMPSRREITSSAF